MGRYLVDRRVEDTIIDQGIVFHLEIGGDDDNFRFRLLERALGYVALGHLMLP